MRDGKVVVHNYGAGGVGFQASWCVQLIHLNFTKVLTHFLVGVWRDMPLIYFLEEHECRGWGPSYNDNTPYNNTKESRW